MLVAPHQTPPETAGFFRARTEFRNSEKKDIALR